MKKLLKRARAWLRGEATTLGVSPKILAAPIGALITAALNRAGLPIESLAADLGVSVSLVNGAVLTAAALIAGYVLTPGAVVPNRVKR